MLLVVGCLSHAKLSISQIDYHIVASVCWVPCQRLSIFAISPLILTVSQQSISLLSINYMAEMCIWLKTWISHPQVKLLLTLKLSKCSANIECITLKRVLCLNLDLTTLVT